MTEAMTWGVLGAANIALKKVIPGMQGSPAVRFAALASRDLAKAEAAAASLGIPKAYGSYEALLADPTIEAIYNPLPNHLHVPWTLKALEAGKHVLCEKPIALTADEAKALIAARDRSGKQVIEAFMVRQHPQWLRARALLAAGAIGPAKLVQFTFTYHNVDPSNVRNQADIGGGGLYDIGCYAITLGRFLFGAEPSRAAGLIDRAPVMGTDRLASALVDFGGGRQLVFSCSTQLHPFQRLEVFGNAGRLEVPIAVNANPEDVAKLAVDRGGDRDPAKVTIESFPLCDQYRLQGEYAVEVFRGAAPDYPIENAIANMAVIDAIFRSAETGRFEAI
jgi:predicted dehydrogenase